MEKLIKIINNKKAIIGVIGLGYVGLPLLLRYVESGFKVIGFDTDETKIDLLRNGESYIAQIPSKRIESAVNQSAEFTTNFSDSKRADALIICVPTPLGKFREPDLSFVTSSVDNLLPYIRNGQILSLESTTYPGTTEEEIMPRLHSLSLEVGRDVFLVYSPEREDPGNKNFSTKTTPKIVGGYTANCLKVGEALYGMAIDQVVTVTSTKAAEMTKLLENIYRAVNIGLVNEMKIVADRMGVDIHEVIRAASTKPFGFTPFYPGPGLGGHCIPIDPFYFSWKAREFGLSTRFIELAGEINTNMPKWVVSKIVDALNERGKSVKDAKVLILGVTYKKNIDDLRESPAIEMIELLKEKGAIINYSDPFIKSIPKMRNHNLNLSCVEINNYSISNYDCLVIATDHDKFNYSMIQRCAKLIIDTRGVYLDQFENVIKA